MKTPRLTGDTALTLLLVALLLDMFLLEPLAAWAGTNRIIDVAFTLVVLFAVVAMAGGRTLRLLGGVLAGSTLVARWLELEGADRALVIWRDASGIALLGLVTAVVLRQVLAPGRITGHRIRGAVVTYLLIALVFSLVYSLIELAVPGSFTVAGSPTPPLTRGADGELLWVYYSLVTLTTLGYGDVTPISELARRLAVLEALIGQLFVAVLIARLVSLEIAHRNDPS